MPTGYTADLCDRDVDFTEFTLKCARAFGALVTMRDDPMDASIPDGFEPSSYHLTARQEAESEYLRLSHMDEPQKLAFGTFKRDSYIIRYQGYIQKAREVGNRLSFMCSKVSQWTPPTSNHLELKAFMLQQLDETIKHDGSSGYYDKELKTASETDPLSYYHEELASRYKSISYHREEYNKEVVRCQERSKWVKDLKSSLLL